ncbi:uncharacterized protein LOC110234363 isoform X1 [Exaiptasia diaphana]|uniref:DUF4773 domain-containing protein n=1 Tax=Exaiptasia diaphana TaxID=2652724 RepID=A0A913WX69_EXADI|nr:uncharacterized protein LOC110234363 isoform X1 [Exaiptasia diaphana]
MKNSLILLLIVSCLVVFVHCKSKHQANSNRNLKKAEKVFYSDKKNEKKEDKQQASGSFDGLSGTGTNVAGEQDNNDEDEIASGSGEDLNKRKQVQPEEQLDSGCKCEGLTCECCGEAPVIGEVCVDARAMKKGKDNVLKAAIVRNGKDVKSIEKKLKDPTEFCLKLGKAKGCVILHDISLDDNKFKGCVTVTAKAKIFGKEFDKKFKLGCFGQDVKDLAPQQDEDVPIRLRHGKWLKRKQNIPAKQ